MRKCKFIYSKYNYWSNGSSEYPMKVAAKFSHVHTSNVKWDSWLNCFGRSFIHTVKSTTASVLCRRILKVYRTSIHSSDSVWENLSPDVHYSNPIFGCCYCWKLPSRSRCVYGSCWRPVCTLTTYAISHMWVIHVEVTSISRYTETSAFFPWRRLLIRCGNQSISDIRAIRIYTYFAITRANHFVQTFLLRTTHQSHICKYIRNKRNIGKELYIYTNCYDLRTIWIVADAWRLQHRSCACRIGCVRCVVAYTTDSN